MIKYVPDGDLHDTNYVNSYNSAMALEAVLNDSGTRVLQSPQIRSLDAAKATLKIGVCYFESRNFGKCFAYMRLVIEKFPVSPQVNSAYYYIGLGHFQQGHYSRAIAALERVGTALPPPDRPDDDRGEEEELIHIS